MKKLILPVLLVAVLFACENMKTAAVCGDYKINMKFVDDGNKLFVRINGEDLSLNLVQSASGAKYDAVMKNGETLVLWNKGENWTMFIDDGPAIICK